MAFSATVEMLNLRLAAAEIAAVARGEPAAGLTRDVPPLAKTPGRG